VNCKRRASVKASKNVLAALNWCDLLQCSVDGAKLVRNAPRE